MAVVQARMTSTRLPGKTLADVGGEPMLALLLRRLERASELDGVVVATSTDQADDAIEELGRRLSFEVYRGSREDVLGRFVGACEGHSGAVARITADCPLIDPEIVDEVIRLFHGTDGCAYASNIEPRTYPDGLDVEVVACDALRRLADATEDPYDREHVTAAIRRDLGRYPSAALVSDSALRGLRWTVDTADDLDFVRLVVARLERRRYTAGMQEIVTAVREEPSLAHYRGPRG
jgi:spore coat polysaccharide biosynthesis protein SpsF (cytidylyltransferase family)